MFTIEEIIEIPEGTNKIEVRKSINKVVSNAKRIAKPNVCALCGKTVKNFCNSHSVPQMSLKPIAHEGLVLHCSAVLGFDKDIIDNENGVNKSGTFHCICKECDGTYFQDYENPNNITNPPTDKMLAEIAVKNFLLQLNKTISTTEIYKIAQEKGAIYGDFDDLINSKKLDKLEQESELDFHKNNADNNEVGGYQILVWKVLPHIVPIAMQSAIVVTKDMEGRTINDIYNMDSNVKMQYLHLAVLPVGEVSVIISFYHKRDKKYRSLRHQLNSVSDSKKLQYINYLIFKYTENYYMSKEVENEISKNKRLRHLAQENDGVPNLGMLDESNSWGVDYKPVREDEIPNFLDAKWAVKNT